MFLLSNRKHERRWQSSPRESRRIVVYVVLYAPTLVTDTLSLTSLRSVVATKLNNELEGWLASVENLDGVHAQAVIAPHAGYSYSGPAAAHAYGHIDASLVYARFWRFSWRMRLMCTCRDRVYVLGPSHHIYIKGCALSTFDEYQTPLGNLKLDQQGTRALGQHYRLLIVNIYTAEIARLHATGRFEWMTDEVDTEEHSIEMHLPYIYKVMKECELGLLWRLCAYWLSRKGAPYSIVPILVGALSDEREALYGQLLAPLLSNPRNLFIISSDFCHWGRRFNFCPHEPSLGPIHATIDKLDREAMAIIETINPVAFQAYISRTHNTICGRHPIAVLLFALESLNKAAPGSFSLKFTRYTRSSEVTRTNDSSVSYASAVCTSGDASSQLQLEA